LGLATVALLAVSFWIGAPAGSTSGLGSGSVAPSAAPANDFFANAQRISGASGSVTGSNVGATGEAGEPDNARVSAPIQSVWYKWTVPFQATWSFDTCGSSFDTTIGIYQGNAVGSLYLLATGDDDHTGACGNDSRVILQGTAGKVYRISVDGYLSATGSLVLNWAVPTCTITGTPGPDTINGTQGNDVICSAGGNDVVFGSGGNDTILGGPGNDTLGGEGGNDFVVGNGGGDTLLGESGQDNLNAVDLVNGNDSMNGGSGTDICYGDINDPFPGCP
jgi:Ca2+-binding RTX toxin-like protein